MAKVCEREGERQSAALHRDNSRFKLFFDNGKPVLADDCEGEASTTPILLMIKQRTVAH